jgi:hypothetical protein
MASHVIWYGSGTTFMNSSVIMVILETVQLFPPPGDFEDLLSPVTWGPHMACMCLIYVISHMATMTPIETACASYLEIPFHKTRNQKRWILPYWVLSTEWRQGKRHSCKSCLSAIPRGRGSKQTAFVSMKGSSMVDCPLSQPWSRPVFTSALVWDLRPPSLSTSYQRFMSWTCWNRVNLDDLANGQLESQREFASLSNLVRVRPNCTVIFDLVYFVTGFVPSFRLLLKPTWKALNLGVGKFGNYR